MNKNNFSLGKMTEKFKSIITPYITIPQQTKLILPKLNRVK